MAAKPGCWGLALQACMHGSICRQSLAKNHSVVKGWLGASRAAMLAASSGIVDIKQMKRLTSTEAEQDKVCARHKLLGEALLAIQDHVCARRVHNVHLQCSSCFT